MDNRIQLKVPRWMKERLRYISDTEGKTMVSYVFEAMDRFADTAPELPDDADAAIHIRNSAVGQEILHLADKAAMLRYGSTRRARSRIVRAAVAEALRRG